MIRIFDIVIASIASLILLPIIILLYIMNYLDNKSPFFYQIRIGKNKQKFTLIKFRTMKKGTKSRATHLIDHSNITRLGRILRKSKLDEIPQLYNVLKGEMSLVGPRPCLPSQVKLIEIRSKYDLYKFSPGITGLAQIKSIDMSDPVLLSKTDYQMMKNLNLFKYFYYLILTFFGRGFGDRVQ